MSKSNKNAVERVAPKPTEAFKTIGEPKETFVTISNTMRRHKAYRSLNGNALLLYTDCRNQQFKPDVNRPKAAEYGIPENKALWVFKFPERLAKTMGYSPPSFRRAMDELIEHGLIDCLSCGKHSKMDSVYIYSDRWKAYGTDKFELPANRLTSSLIRKHYPHK